MRTYMQTCIHKFSNLFHIARIHNVYDTKQNFWLTSRPLSRTYVCICITPKTWSGSGKNFPTDFQELIIGRPTGKQTFRPTDFHENSRQVIGHSSWKERSYSISSLARTKKKKKKKIKEKEKELASKSFATSRRRKENLEPRVLGISFGLVTGNSSEITGKTGQ